MMEFYNSKKYKAKKEHICEMCGSVIHIGENYYRQSGKFDGEFFDRSLHTHCNNMMQDFCYNVDNEFSWEQITDYIQDNYCNECEHAACNDDQEDWEECDFYVTECPKLIKQFSDEEEKDNGKHQD